MILNVNVDKEVYYITHGNDYYIRTFDELLYDFIPYEIPEIFKSRLYDFSIVYEQDCIGFDKIEFETPVDLDIILKQKWYVYILEIAGRAHFFANFERASSFLINTDK